MADLSLKGVSKRFTGGVPVVSNFNLEIEDKEFMILVGPPGCGKSSTLRMIAGLEEISEGELYMDGKLINNTPPKQRDVALVFQNYAPYPHMTVFENLAFGLTLRKMPKAEIKQRVTEAARILEIEHLLNRKPKALSGIQRQRVALGRAIVRNPKVFLLDEPLANLDAKLRVQMRSELTRLHRRLATTFIYVTHDQNEAMTMGTRIVVMKDGLIKQVSSPQTLYETPNSLFVASFIGSPQMNLIDVSVLDENGVTYLLFGDARIALPASKGRKPEVLGYDGKEVVMGIRPEDIHVEELSRFPDSQVRMTADTVETTDAQLLVYMLAEGRNLTAQIAPGSAIKTGDVITAALDPGRIHLFDKETKQAITN